MAVAIASVLAMIAYPAYQAHVLRSHRLEAMSALLAVAAAQEKHQLRHNAFSHALTAAPPAGLGLPDRTPNAFYEISIASAGRDDFTANATAVGRQAADAQCAQFSLDASGARRATSEDCWRR